MTSDLGDNKEVSEDLNQSIKPSSQELNPDADAFCSSSTPLAFTEPSSSCELESENTDIKSVEIKEDPVDCKDEGTGFDGKVVLDHVDLFPESAMPAVIESGSESLDLVMDSVSMPPQSQLEAFSNEDQLNAVDEVQPIDGTIPLTELKAMLQQQLEYYFSRENLATDTYLLSQMDSDQYVPIGTVANFNQVKCLTRDLNLIVDVLRESPNVQVDEAGEKVRPSYKRCVLILREIPESTPVKDIEALFSGENCPKFVSCEFAHNSSWYVTFDTDEDAQQAYRYLREEVKTFQGRPIMARIKAKPIGRASFIPPYKNGLCQTEEAEGYSGQSTQQQQQQQQRYPYSSVAPVTYSNQQVFPPFYPPTLLQAWAPTPPCFDLGAVFSMNGLAPQAAFKPLGTSRHNFHTVRGRGSKSFNRIQPTPDSSESCNRFYDRNQTLPYLHRQHVAHTLNSAVSGFGFMPYPFTSKSPYTFGLDMHDLFSNGSYYSKKTDVHSSLYPANNHYSSQTTNPSVRTSNKQETVHSGRESSSQVASPVDKPSDTKDVGSQPQPQRSRSRKKKKDDVNNINCKKLEGCGSDKAVSAKDVKPLCPKFEMEAASFPPLPGSSETDTVEETYENRLSDVVKGTTKPSTRDSKTQTESVPTDTSPVVATKDTATLTNGDLSTVLTPPASPVMLETATEVESLHLIEEPVSEVLPLSCTSTSSACTVITPTTAAATAATVTSNSLSSSSMPLPIASSPPITPVPAPKETLVKCSTRPAVSRHLESVAATTSHAIVNGHMETDTVHSIEDDKPSRRLTYSEVAQRAREKVEKLAQEIKEKERQEAAARQQRQQEINVQSRQISGRAPFKEFSNRGRPGERFGFRDYKERKNGFSAGVDRDRFRRTANRSPQEDQEEEPVK